MGAYSCLEVLIYLGDLIEFRKALEEHEEMLLKKIDCLDPMN